MEKPQVGHKVLFENDHVRVLDIWINPGETSAMHTHSPNVVYSLSTNQLAFSFPDGTSREVTIKEGDIVWSDGGTHEVKNLSETVDRGIVVELKSKLPIH